MFVKNSFEYDARVRREAAALSADGHAVTVIAIHVPGVTPRKETTHEGVEIIRVEKPRFGIDRLIRWYRRADERVGGRLPDILQPSTATPGRDGGSRPQMPDVPGSESDPGPTTVLQRTIGLLLGLGKRLIGSPLRWLADRILSGRMLDVALGERADAFHAHDLNTLGVAMRAKSKTRGAFLVYDSHELHTARSRAGMIERAMARKREAELIPHADHVVVASPAYGSELVRMYGIESYTTIRNVPRFVAVRPQDLHTSLGIPRDLRVLIYQGSIQEHRGIEQTVDALRLLPGCFLLVAGYGHHRPALERYVRDRGLGDRVRFVGPYPHEELLELTAGASVGMCCIVDSSLSYRLSLPNKLFEYVLCGIPVVASNFEEMGAFVREQDVGEVCDPNDPSSIAAAVQRITERPAREAVCRRNAEKAARIHNWQIESRALLRIYDGSDITRSVSDPG